VSATLVCNKCGGSLAGAVFACVGLCNLCYIDFNRNDKLNQSGTASPSASCSMSPSVSVSPSPSISPSIYEEEIKEEPKKLDRMLKKII
jgi:hypothetical protein